MDRFLIPMGRWIHWKKIEPQQCATALDRCLQLRREDEHVAVYDLVGGAVIPFAQAQVIRLKQLGKGEFRVRLCEAIRIPMSTVLGSFGGNEKFSPLFPDPRNPRPEFASVRRIPMGELRLLYTRPERLDAVVLSESLLLEWGTPIS